MKRTRQKKWDRDNLQTLSTRWLNEDADELRATCAAQGTTVYHVISELLQEWLRDNRPVHSRRSGT